MKGKGIVKKFIATVILTLMLFASCSQVISYAATVYVSASGYTLYDTNRNNTNETLHIFKIDEDDDGTTEDNMDIYCLRGGAGISSVEHGYNKVNFIGENATNAEISSFETASNIVFKTDISNKPDTGVYTYNYGKGKENKTSSIRAIHWFIKNMAITYSGATLEQKNYSKQNVLNLITTFRDNICVGNKRSKIN